jgi:AcrR family transcriptional regulator
MTPISPKRAFPMPDVLMPDATDRMRRQTAQKLLAAAAGEFNEVGFDGTDTNKIARRAGFSPQTFYRWFADKTDIFIRVYEDWQQQEVGILRKLMAEKASDARLVQACVAHHKAYLRFRRSLRQLATEDDRVRVARAQSRLRQIEFLNSLRNEPLEPAQVAAMLLQLERLTDALAEAELADMGLSPAPTEALLADLIHELRNERPSLAVRPPAAGAGAD